MMYCHENVYFINLYASLNIFCEGLLFKILTHRQKTLKNVEKQKKMSKNRTKYVKNTERL